MTRPIRFDLEAETELEEAAGFYESREPNLGRAFLWAVDASVNRIREGPERYSVHPGVSPRLGVRRILVRRFPFTLVYLPLPDEVRVLAVAHSKKRPQYWLDRL